MFSKLTIFILLSFTITMGVNLGIVFRIFMDGNMHWIHEINEEYNMEKRIKYSLLISGILSFICMTIIVFRGGI